MKNIDSTIISETIKLAGFVLVFSVIMQAVFLVIGKWDITVLLGNLLSAAASVLNFFLMGVSVQKAVGKEAADAKKLMTASHTLRSFFMFLVLLCGVLVPVFNTWAVIIPIFFPRIAMALRPLTDKKAASEGKGGEE